MVWTFLAALIAAAAIGALLWGRHRAAELRRLRRKGVAIIPADDGYVVASGCLGALGFFALLFVTVALSFDLVERMEATDWLAWVFAIGLIAALITSVVWSVVRVGRGLAAVRLRVDGEGIALYRWRRSERLIRWHRPWQLKRWAVVVPSSSAVDRGAAEWTLRLQLRQGRTVLTLDLDMGSAEAGGLPPFEGGVPEAIVAVSDDAAWLYDEILRRQRIGRSEVEAGGSGEGLDLASGWTPSAPGAALMAAFDFDADALDRNRSGALSQPQRAALRSDRNASAITYAVLGTLSLAGALYGLMALLRGTPFSSVGPLLIVCVLLLLFCGLMALAVASERIDDVVVASVAGPIHLQDYAVRDERWLRVGERAFRLTGNQAETFVEGGVYRLYTVEQGPSHSALHLLSVEPLTQEGVSG
jgi:hypothetical protein